VVFNLAETDPRFYYDMTDYFVVPVLSTEQLAEPYDEWTKKPAGIGSYQLLEANVGENRVFENAPGTHYFQEPSFDELQILFVLEPATRLSMLLTGQAHIADLPMELANQGEKQGLKQWLTTLAPSVLFGVFGGNFAGPPLADGQPDWSFPLYDDTLPWTQKKVRQAMNMAIDRDELITELFADSAIPIIGPPMWWPRNNGWNPQWVEDFKTNYRYDPAAARELLTEAGYPDGFTAKWKAFARPGVPWRELVEAYVGYMKAIGVTLEVEEMEFQAFRGEYRQFNHSGWGFFWTAQENLPSTRFGFHHNMRRNQQQWYVTETLQRNFDKLETTVPQAERHAILKEMGDELFYDYALMPLAAIRPRYVADPKVVAEFLSTGLNGVRDLQFVVPAQ
jgi:ABC-type transport system substrate-binding protein